MPRLTKMEKYPIQYRRNPLIDIHAYKELYEESIKTPDSFWKKQSDTFITWFKKPSIIQSGSFEGGNVKWFPDGELNVSYNCIDRHVESGHGEKTALISEGNDGESKTISYSELLSAVSKLANVLKKHGVKKGDRVCIYLPMIPEAVFAMLACARIGAVHTVVFAGFSAISLETRIKDSGSKLVITADQSKRGSKVIPLLSEVDSALSQCPDVHTVLVVTTDKAGAPYSGKHIDYYHEVSEASDTCAPEIMKSEDPFFILYTSGSTGKPKGILHTTGGYLLYAAVTHKYCFDYHENDIYWCTADVGWITGHSYVVYGPLCNRATTLIYEGIPTYPDASRCWEIVDKHSVTTFYSSPTAIRSLMSYGDAFVEKTSRKSLLILGTVGEPINPEAWRWYNTIVGNGNCPIIDTWWQTETGGFMIAPLPGATPLKPGSATLPFFGITPVIVDDDGNELIGIATGKLMLKGAWPGMMRSIYNDHPRYMETYFKSYPGLYLTGDGAMRDEDSYIWITGRIDDVMNISGRLIGTAEVESALVLHPDVAEAGVVAVPDAIRGSSITAFVILNQNTEPRDALHAELISLVKKHVGSFAKPDTILFVKNLPKTRSGKIMRRLLRMIGSGQTENLGDTSTLADVGVLEELISVIKR